MRAYTLDAAYCSGEETIKGSVEEGKLADITVFSSDPRIVPTSEISDINVEMVILDGKMIFSKR